jgi:YVTN family beta-propeller protein
MVVADIPVRDGFGAGEFAFTPDGKVAYVVTSLEQAVLVIDTATKMAIAKVILPEIADGIAVSADGKHAYVAGTKSISVIDTSTNTVAATVPLQSRGFAIATLPLPPITR